MQYFSVNNLWVQLTYSQITLGSRGFSIVLPLHLTCMFVLLGLNCVSNMFFTYQEHPNIFLHDQGMEEQFLDVTSRFQITEANNRMEHPKDFGSSLGHYLRTSIYGSVSHIYVHSVLACCFHKCPYDIYRLLNGSQDKGPLKKNVKNAKSTIKTTRLKLGNVSRCGTWAGITVPAPPRQVSKERWILGILWFKTIEGYAVTTLGTLKFLRCNMLFKYIGNSLSCVSVCAKGVPERPRQGFVEHLERSQNTTCTTSLLTAKVWNTFWVRFSLVLKSWVGRHMAWCQASWLLLVPVQE